MHGDCSVNTGAVSSRPAPTAPTSSEASSAHAHSTAANNLLMQAGVARTRRKLCIAKCNLKYVSSKYLFPQSQRVNDKKKPLLSYSCICLAAGPAVRGFRRVSACVRGMQPMAFFSRSKPANTSILESLPTIEPVKNSPPSSTAGGTSANSAPASIRAHRTPAIERAAGQRTPGIVTRGNEAARRSRKGRVISVWQRRFAAHAHPKIQATDIV